MQSFFANNAHLLMENPELFEKLQEIIVPKTFAKGEVMHEANSLCKHFFLLTSGLARVFYFKDGKDVTVHIAQEEESITAIDSFIQRKKSKYTVEAIEDIECLMISREDIDKLSTESHAFEHFSRMFLEKAYIDLAQRLDSILLHTSQERYENLLQKRPDFFQRVSGKHLASFLGMSPENLSRIRAK